MHSVEITYVDPVDGDIRQKDVFCDMGNWGSLLQAKLLVSAELVNSLSDAHGSRTTRFKQIHKRLENGREGFLCDLWNLRQLIERVGMQITKEKPADAESGEIPQLAEVAEAPELEELVQQEQESCPIHFYRADQYLDMWEKECLANAIASYLAFLFKEMKELQERIDVMGGGSWREMLEYFLKNGYTGEQLMGMLMKQCKDKQAKIDIVNKLTDGLYDKHADLEIEVKVLKKEFNEAEQRTFATDKLIYGQTATMDALHKKLKQLNKKSEPKEESKTETTARVAEQKNKLWKVWRERRVEMAEEIERLQRLVADWKTRVGKLDGVREETARLESQAVELERHSRVLQVRVARFEKQAEDITGRIAAVEVKMASEVEEATKVKEKLSVLPPVKPQALAYQRWLREIAKLKAKDAELRKSMLKPYKRIKAMRNELRILYAKLGWDWDLSDSENEDGDKPYWKRRQLAKDGFLPFNQHDILNKEQPYKDKRKDKIREVHHTSRKAHTEQQMLAKRQRHGDVSVSTMVPHSTLEDLTSASFDFLRATEEELRRISDDVQQFAKAAPQQDPLSKLSESDLQWYCTRSVQMQRLLDATKEQLGGCVQCVIEALPEDGELGRVREDLCDLLDRLDDLFSSASSQKIICHTVLQGDQVRTFDRLSDALQNGMEDAIKHSERVDTIGLVMRHLVKFRELRDTLSELHWEAQPPQGMVPSGPKPARPDDLDATQKALPPKALPPSPASGGPFRPTARARELIVDEDTLEDLRPDAVGAKGPCPFSGDGQGRPKRILKADPERPDLGFRREGGGEESVEMWSLFKASVSTTSDPVPPPKERTRMKPLMGASKPSMNQAEAEVEPSTAAGSGALKDRMRATDAKLRRHQARFEGDFGEYMENARRNLGGSASTPELRPAEKNMLAAARAPKLPHLISSSSAVSVKQEAAAKLWGANSKLDSCVSGSSPGLWRSKQKLPTVMRAPCEAERRAL